MVAKEFSAAAWLWLSARQWSEPAYLPLTPDDPAYVGGYRVYARLGGRRGRAGVPRRPPAAWPRRRG